MQKIEVLKSDDRRSTGYDIQGNIYLPLVVKALREAGILLRGENINAIYLTEDALGYYATLD